MSKLILLAGLSLYYLYVLYSAATPLITDEYRAYYVANETDFNIPNSRNLRFEPVILGQQEDATSERLVFDGWWKPEGTELWSRRRRSRIRFDMSEADLARIEGKITLDYGIHDRSQDLRISFNQVPIEQKSLSQNGILTVTIPKALFAQRNTLTFDIPTARRASWQDERIIGIRMRHVTVQ